MWHVGSRILNLAIFSSSLAKLADGGYGIIGSIGLVESNFLCLHYGSEDIAKRVCYKFEEKNPIGEVSIDDEQIL